MPKKYILAIDQGTTGTRAILYGRNGKSCSSAYCEHTQYYPQPGWIEHNPDEILAATYDVIGKALSRVSAKPSDIAAIGITNQRETTVLWNRKTGKAIYRAIVWQDRRTSPFCAQLKKEGREKDIRKKTGLVVDPYFSATKISWILENVAGARAKALKGEIAFGTIDSWLLWHLTGGKSHTTDFTNASRTLLFNIYKKDWDEGLLKLFKVPRLILPRVQSSGSDFGKTVKRGPLEAGIPIYSLVGDQQAALYGQGCIRKGQSKNTYGTGCFLMMNLGTKADISPRGLLTTMACDEKGQPVYAYEGAIFIAGAAVQWLRDGLKFFKRAGETESLIRKCKDTDGVVFIPAFSGLGSPYWEPNAKGMISGLTRGTKKEHIIRAALESIAQQSADVLERMQESAHAHIKELRVDGGATKNHFLMQFQADLMGIPILVSDITESTAWGAAKLAGISAGFWKSTARLDQCRKYTRYSPKMKPAIARQSRLLWKREIQRLLSV